MEEEHIGNLGIVVHYLILRNVGKTLNNLQRGMHMCMIYHIYRARYYILSYRCSYLLSGPVNVSYINIIIL